MSRLEEILGTEILLSPSGDEIRLGHTFHEVSAIHNLIHTYKPYWFVELGVHEGGLSFELIRKWITLYYVGIDINCSYIRPEVRKLFTNPMTTLLCDDCYSLSLLDKILDVIQNSQGIFYCDGGNKALEMRFFSKYMKPDDIIMCHDYWDETRNPFGLKGYGTTLEFPKPEVLPEDVDMFLHSEDWELLTDPDFSGTRIIAFMRK